MRRSRQAGESGAPVAGRRPCIGAILYNEAPYLPHWIAYHLAQGFEHFFLGDHDSDDGTTALLESLQSLGLVTRIFHPRLEIANAQRRVYADVIARTGDGRHFVTFIDADEYLVPTDETERAATILGELLAPDDVAAVGMNWRNFGSSGRLEPGVGSVIERFHRCNAVNAGVNRHIKSAVKPECTTLILAHRAALKPGFHYVHADGTPQAFDQTSGFAHDIAAIDGRLRVHHYIVKSWREFLERKANRGRCAKGAAMTRGREYFGKYERDQVDTCRRAMAFEGATRARLAALERELAGTGFEGRLFGAAVEARKDRVTGQFLAEARLAQPSMILTSYGDLGEAAEHAVALDEPAAVPTGSGAPPVFRYSFSIDVSALGDGPAGRGLRLRLHGHAHVFLDTREAAAAPLAPDEGLNLERTAGLFHVGEVGTLSAQRAAGWARPLDDAVAVSVEVEADGRVVASQRADRFRSDLLLGHKHPTGHAAFDIDLTSLGLAETAALRVRVQGTDLVLPPCP